jgi:hypothetical protein
MALTRRAMTLALSEYAGLRDDTDIRKCYLQGRFGGVPKV